MKIYVLYIRRTYIRAERVLFAFRAPRISRRAARAAGRVRAAGEADRGARARADRAVARGREVRARPKGAKKAIIYRAVELPYPPRRPSDS